MGDLSKNLSRHEMACQCGCGFDTVDIKLVEVIQTLCDYLRVDMGDKPILIITGPNRCPEHNTNTPGAGSNSQHIYGRAMDFKIKINGKYLPPKQIYNHLNAKYPDKYGLGLYHNRVHLDTRTGKKGRW